VKLNTTSKILYVAFFLALAVTAVALHKNDKISDFYAKEVEERNKISLALLSEMPEDFTVRSSNPRIRLVVYEDTDCPFCAKFELALEQLLKAYPDDVAVTYRYMELAIHPFSSFEHRALECVGMHEGIENYRAFKSNALYKNEFKDSEEAREQIISLATPYIAQEHIDAVTSCFEGEDVKKRIARKINSGKALGVEKTPTWFVIQDSTYEEFAGTVSYADLVTRLKKFGL